MTGHFKWSKLESVDYLIYTYFNSITEWLPEALGLYRIIFDTVHSSWILSLLLFTLAKTNFCIVTFIKDGNCIIYLLYV